MVYYQPNISDYFTALDVSNTTRPVRVIYNGTGLHTITGPVPLVDISQSINRNGAGAIDGHTTRIDIAGKIIRNASDSQFTGSGIGPIISGINSLKSLFSKSNFGILEIQCDVNNVIFSASGVKVVDISFSKSTDNWTQTADYSVSLEYYEPSGLSEGYRVQSTSDSWSIEPLEEAIYANFSQSLNMKGETHNPELLPTAPNDTSPVPGSFNGQGSIGGISLNVINIPQYRISHRISAVGIPSGTGAIVSNTAYLEAKKWIENRLSLSFFQSSPLSGIAYFMNTSSPQVSSFSNNLFLYNHLRSTNFSVSEGSYEVNDTWLAMPSGIAYIEDYSIDSSTDDKFTKTVRVQGQIKGLSMVPFSIMSGDPPHMIPSGGLISLSSSTGQMASSSLAHTIPDTSNTSKIANIESNKYQNSLSGWLYDIKPYLYRRASLVMQSSDRNRSYVDSTNPNARPGNPLYCNENLLNPNPISTTEGHDPRKGTISYSVEYNNKLMLISGVISESIGISDNGPTDVFGETFVIGRRLGPVIQSLNAKTSSRKDVSIDVTVVPPSSVAGLLMTNSACPLYISGSIYSGIDALIEGLKPFGVRNSFFGSLNRASQPGTVFTSQDSQNWNPTEGRYSRSVSWVYQQCSNTRNYLDH